MNRYKKINSPCNKIQGKATINKAIRRLEFGDDSCHIASHFESKREFLRLENNITKSKKWIVKKWNNMVGHLYN